MDHPGQAYPPQSVLRPCLLLKSYDLCVDETLGCPSFIRNVSVHLYFAIYVPSSGSSFPRL